MTTLITGSITLPTGVKQTVIAVPNIVAVTASRIAFGSDRSPIDNSVFPKNLYTRIYGGLGKGFPSLANVPNGCKPHVSIKDSPTPTLLNPALDALTHPIYLEWHHEPEGDMTTSEHAAGQLMLHSTVKANKNAHLVTIVETYTRYAQVHGKTMTDGKPATIAALNCKPDVLGMDCEIDKLFPGYPVYPDPATFFAPIVNSAKSLGVPFVIPELGWILMPGDDGTKLAQWYTDSAKYLATQNCVGVGFYDTLGSTGEYRLPSGSKQLAACQQICNAQ